jgi:hypothetical protein
MGNYDFCVVSSTIRVPVAQKYDFSVNGRSSSSISLAVLRGQAYGVAVNEGEEPVGTSSVTGATAVTQVPATAISNDLQVTVILQDTAFVTPNGDQPCMENTNGCGNGPIYVEGAACNAGDNLQLTVTDENGTVLASGDMNAGLNPTEGKMSNEDVGCDINLNLGTVPVATEYGIFITDEDASTSTQPTYYSLAEMQSDGYQVGLTYETTD